MRNILIISLLAFIGFSCKTAKITSNRSPYSQMIDTSKVFSQSFTGLALYDLEKKQMIFERNAERYFTPASNTKLYTFYACIKTLGDSIPALRYVVRGDSLIFWGTGDPTFLHPDTKNTKVLDFLKSQRRTKQFYFSDGNFTNETLGLGWAWDDYNDYYQAELSPLPMYGNIVRVNLKDKIRDINPAIFQNSFYVGKNTGDYIKRTVGDNQFVVPKNIMEKAGYNQDIPYKTSTALTQQLLIDTLHKNVNLLKIPVAKDAKTIFSSQVDPIYRTMLQESDNFLAEQLLLLSGTAAKDSINSSFAIQDITQKYLQDLPDAPKWVDGSGLSRYNLFTPRSIAKLLEKMYAEIPQERLFSVLAIGGQAGTIKNSFKAEKPYVFAKSGSFSGTYNLSGYLITKQGKTLIFSFMNNNFTRRTGDVRKEVEKVLNWVYENE